jgi:hypothetical protein
MLQDKSLYALVMAGCTIVVNALGKKLGIEIDPELMAMFVMACITYIGGNKWKSRSVLLAEIEANAELERAKIVASAGKSPEDASAAMNSFLAFAKAAAAGKVPGVPPMPVPVPPASSEVP